MTSMTWTNAPAGFLGLGSVDVRPSVADCTTDVVLARAAAQLRGTGLPFAGSRLRHVAPEVVAHTGVAAVGTDQRGIAPIGSTYGFTTENDGTTLGNPSSRRPQS